MKFHGRPNLGGGGAPLGRGPLCDRWQLVEVPCEDQLDSSEGLTGPAHRPRDGLQLVEELPVQHGHLPGKKNKTQRVR